MVDELQIKGAHSWVRKEIGISMDGEQTGMHLCAHSTRFNVSLDAQITYGA